MGQAVPTRSILIVEDEAFIRYDLVDFFEDAGFRVFHAGEAEEAISIIEAERNIQTVFTDVQMPGVMDGIRLAHYVRDRFPPTILIVASGAHRLTSDQLPARSVFVPKPYDRQALLAAILARS